MEENTPKLSGTMEVPDIQVDAADDYTKAIELSNACREFYRNRVKATENFKQSMSNRNNNNCVNKRTSIDVAMDTLRTEMASLMDQDLSLMKQLLTLNEAIEDLKTKRLYHLSKDSLRASSQEMHVSDWSVSETDMFEETDDEEFEKKLLDAKDSYQLSSISLPVPLTKQSKANTDFIRRSDLAIVHVVREQVHRTVRHEPQSSMDSGYGDDVPYHKIYRGPVEVSF